MADEINTQKQSQTRIVTASQAILAVVAVTTASSVAISRYNSVASNNVGNDNTVGGSTHHVSANIPQEVSSNANSDNALQITQTIQQLNQVSNSLSQESIDIFNSLYSEQAERSSRRRLSMSEGINEKKLLRGLSAKSTDQDKSNIQKISLNEIKQSQKQSEQNRKLGRGVGMKRPKGHNMLQNMDNKWSSSSNDSHHSEDANMLQRYSSPSWDHNEWDDNWNMNTEWGGKSGKSGHWEYHPSHDEERYWDHPPSQKQWGQPSWNMNEWNGGGGKSGKSGYKYQGWGHEVPVVGWEEHPSYSNWWGHSSSSSEDYEEEDTLYSTSEVDSETEEVDVNFSASSVAGEDPDDKNGEVEEEAEDGEEGEDGVIISYGYCGVDAEEASRRCKKACTSSSDCKEDKQCFASPSCDPDAAAAVEGKQMNRNGDFEELDRQVEFGQMDADGNMVEVAAADESSTSFTSSAMVEEEETFFSASSVQEEEPMYSSTSAFANAHYQVSSPQEDYESHHSGWNSPSQGYYQEEVDGGWEGGSTEMVECHPVEEVMWSGGRKLYGKASQGWWAQPPPSWHQQPAWMGGSKTSKTGSGYGFQPSSSNYNYGGTKAGKAAWGSTQWQHQPPPAWSHGPPKPEHHAPVIDHTPQYYQDSPPPQHHPPPVSWNYDPWAKSSKAKSGKTKSGKSCYILVQEPRSSDDFGPSYCGMSFADASNQCSQQCRTDGDCSGGASCYGPITSCGGGPFPPSTTPPSPPGVGYCGMSFADASSTCSQQCSSSGDCSAGFNCYGPITSCGGSGPPPTPPILPPVVSGYCGMSGGDALNQCSRRCTTSADCSGGAQCFSAPGCLVSNGVCGTSQQDASDSCEPSCIDNTDCSGGEQCFPVDISGCGGVISNGFCGSNVGNANEQCKVKCTTDADCSGGGQCFSAPGCIVSNGVCGSSFLDAINKCEPTCTSSADCSGSDQCFSVPKDACPSYCGTSFADAESQCAVKCTKNSDCSGGAKCQGPIPNCTPDVDPPTTEPVYCPEGCPDCDPNSPLPCPRVSMKQVCDKHNDDLYPPGDPKAGTRIANFNDCYDMCKPSFCCIHDSTSTELSPTCAGNIGPNKYENCPLYYPCYIIWWKLHDTIGPATYLRVEGSEEPFFKDLNFETIQQDFIQDKVFFNQLYNHHFDTDDIPTDDTFEDPNNW